MIAEELMIGDWVHVEAHRGFDAQNVKIETIPDNDSDNAYGHHYGFISTWLIGGDNDFRDVETRHLQPIQLTPKIIEKNGFEKNYFFHMKKKQDIWTSCCETNTFVSLFPIEFQDDTVNGWTLIISIRDRTELIHEIDFVHELQHALKFFKIDKKIEL